MTGQLVITEKTSQAKDVRAAVGVRYGIVLPAEAIFRPAGARGRCAGLETLDGRSAAADGFWRPPAAGGNKAAKLKAIRDALRSAKRVWLATDCDREGQLIGQEILEHLNFAARSCG